MEISREQLEYLVENDISIPGIAQVLRVSVSAVKRRLLEFGISSTERKTPVVRLIWMRLCGVYNECSPMQGTRRVQSQLLLNGIKVSQRRVREAMHRTDPQGMAKRWLSVTPRAVYCVSGPLEKHQEGLGKPDLCEVDQETEDGQAELVVGLEEPSQLSMTVEKVTLVWYF